MLEKILHSARFLPILGIALLFSGCAGQGPRSEEHFSQKELEIRLDLAQAYLSNNEPRMALQELNRIQSQGRRLPRFHHTLGYTLLVLGNTEEAAAAFRDAVELDPNHAESWNNLGLALLAMNRFDEAEQAFSIAVDIPTYRTPEVAALNLATLNLDRNRPDLAILHAKKAIELNWRFSRAYLLAAEIELTRGRSAESVSLLKQGAEANLDDPRIMLTLAEYLLLAERPEEALQWLDRLISFAPQSPEAATALEYQTSLQIPDSPQLPIPGRRPDDPGPPEARVPGLLEPAPVAQPDPAHVDSWPSAFIVQIGAFLERTGAEKLQNLYRSKDYPAQIMDIVHRGKTWHVVSIAMAQRLEEARAIAQRFRKIEGMEAVVVKIGQGQYLE